MIGYQNDDGSEFSCDWYKSVMLPYLYSSKVMNDKRNKSQLLGKEEATLICCVIEKNMIGKILLIG